MEPTISLINTALSTAKIAVRYSGYKFGRRKEDDLAIRRKLMLQLDALREHLLNIMEDSEKCVNYEEEIIKSIEKIVRR